jgi:hypothetical protein
LLLVAKGRDGGGVTTHDADPGGPSGLKDSMPEPPQAAEPELDGCGLPVQNRRPTGPPGRHAVDPAGATHTFRFHRRRHLLLGIAALALGVGFLANATQAPLSGWDPSVGDKGLEIWDIVLGLPLVWFGIRQFRVGVQISGGKLIIRGGFLTRTVNAGEIRAITLRNKDNGEGRRRWIPLVELTSRKSLWITSFDCGRADRPPDPNLAASLDEFRVLLGRLTIEPLPPVEHSGSGTGQNDTSGLLVSQDGEQPQDALLGQPHGGEPELDAQGLTVQPPAKGRIYLGVTACLICAAVSAGLSILTLKYHSARNVPAWLAFLGMVLGGLAVWPCVKILDDAKKKKQKLGVAIRVLLLAGGLVGFLSVTIMLGIMGAQTNTS